METVLPRLVRHLPIAVAATLWMGSGAFGQPLERELVGLLRDHPQIQAADKTSQSSRQEIDKALASFYPRVQALTDAGPELIDSPAERGRRQEQGLNPRTRNVATLTVTQNLFNGFASSAATRAARLNAEIAAVTAEGTRQATLFEGVRAYVNVLRQRRLVDLARSNEETIQIQLNLEDERVQRGSGIAVDVLQAKSRLQISKERRVNFEGALQDSVSTYAQVYDHAPELEEMQDPVPPVELLPSQIEEAVDIALNENPAINNGDTTIEVQGEKQRTAMAEYYPKLDVVGKANYEKNRNSVIGQRRDYSIVLQATWDLFTGFSTQAAVAQAAYDQGASKDNFTFATRKVTEQVKLAWQALLTVRERMELLENAINIAAEVFESRKKLREAGKETVINVLDAESEIFNARINFTAASYDERIAVYQLLLAMGRLNGQHLGFENDG